MNLWRVMVSRKVSKKRSNSLINTNKIIKELRKEKLKYECGNNIQMKTGETTR